MAPSVSTASCLKCKNTLKRSEDKLKCGFCSRNFHLNCALEMTPGLTRSIVDAMKECTTGLIFKCESCKQGSSTSLNDIVAKLNDMETRMQNLPTQVSAEISSHLEDISNKLNNCVTKVDKLEEETSLKFKQLEIENNSLRRLLNRADIIISGIPSNIKSSCLIKVVMNICKHYKVAMALSEINTCCWIHKKKDVLVKFNSISKRDLIMDKYHKKYDLKLNQIYTIDINDDDAESNYAPNESEANIFTAGEQAQNENAGDIEARVFLNDNLTSAAAKIKYVGRKLIREKKITKFKVISWDDPTAKLTFKNGSEKVFTLQELISM